MELKITRIREKAKLPFKAHTGDAGYDLCWCPKEEGEYRDLWYKGTFYKNCKLIRPNESIVLATGLKFLFPQGYVLEIKNRSSLASKKGLIVGAHIVDSTYRGEVFVNLHNISGEDQIIEPYERIAQFLFYKVENCIFNEVSVDEYEKNETTRGEGGFGSTGTK